MRPATTVLVLWGLAGGPLAAQSDNTAGAPGAPGALRSWVGERLEYDVKFGILNLGRATLEVAGIDTVRGRESLHIRFLLESRNFVVYRLYNEWDSWIGLHDFASRRFVQDHQEGGREYRNVYEIFPDSGFYRREGVDTTAATSVQPLDDAAFFYFVRTVDLVPGERYEFDRYFKPDRNPVVLEVLGRDTIDVPAGRFATLVIRPIIRGGGIFREGAEGQMWISDDPRRVVVQIKSKFAFGSITMRLRALTEAASTSEVP